MPATKETIRVEGLRELQRAFAVADKELKQDLNTALKDAAEPVRVDAQGFAVSRIRRMTEPWSRMRIGVTRTGVYVAPKSRSRGAGPRARPNLAPRLLGDSMVPALERNQAGVVHEVTELLDTIGRDWARV